MNGQERGQWPLVGRERELAIFTQVWAARRCRGVIVCGPAGVGKSRLAEEFLEQAMAGKKFKGSRVTATAAASTVPLGAIAHLIPTRVDLSDPVKGFTAVAAALAETRRDRQWGVLVDDLHLLDVTSAVLLRQLLDADVIRLIATVRTGEPVSEAVEALTHGDAVSRMDLTSFDLDRVEDLLQAALHGPVGRRTVHSLYQASGGNALFLHELVHGALETKTLASDGQIWELDEGALQCTPRLTELITARLRAAPSAARSALELLALCEPLPLAHAEAVATPEVLAELEKARLIRVRLDRRRISVTLAHPLYGEILRADIPALRRRILLLQQAERVETQGARRRDDALYLATWHMAATGTANPHLLTQAAPLARHAHDYPQVIALLNAVPEQHQTTTTRLLLGEALLELGQSEQAEATLAEADACAVGEQQQLPVTIARTLNLFYLGGRTAEALAINDAARSVVVSAIGRRKLLINEAAMRTMSGEPAQGLALMEDLEEDINQAPNINVWLRGAMGKTAGLAFRGRTGQAVALADHAYAAHVQVAGQPQARVPHPATQLIVSVIALGEAGRLAEARALGARAAADLVTVHAPLARIWLSFYWARVEWQSGHPATARHLFAEAAALARIHHSHMALGLILAGLSASAALLGDIKAAEAARAERSLYPFTGLLAGEDRLCEAWLFAGRGCLGQARSVLVEAAHAARSTGHLMSESMVLTDVARLGGAKEVVDRLAELAQECDGTLASARAHLAAALATDDPDQLLAVSEELQAIGADLLAAEAATAAGAAWSRAGQPRRATAATTRALASAARCQGARTPLLTDVEITAPLTRREREIALLARTGTTSKDIADTLHLSVRTVDNHLQHIYNKLGVSTRRELTDVVGGQ
ncbi:LuxR C-terminal-related transcriptional regulator [Streptomyces sp. NPDC057909]|uniref:LuxR C-terminal-related transcriptional regulator n=1 Tax=Streptomyces sp. NPDC057909 TaxID=3346277 RepID=UPI0036E4C4BB